MEGFFAMGNWKKYLLGVLLVVFVGALVIYFAFPEVLVRLATTSARRSAGLESRSIRVGEHEIAYLEGGSGSPVVLLHGFAASKDLWTAVAKHLTPEYRVIALDIPGFGESSKLPSESYDVGSQVERIHDFVKALHLSRYHLGGMSMGGTIAAVYAATYPEGVISLLVAAAPGVDSQEKSELTIRRERGESPLLPSSEEGVDALLQLAFFNPPSMPGVIKRVLVRQITESRAFNEKILADLMKDRPDALEPYLPSIEARTLIVFGDSDRIVHPSSLAVFEKGIVRHEGAIIENCGHALPRECPDALAQEYLAFLAAP
jgi:abhydrolase domain-containing protein 6